MHPVHSAYPIPGSHRAGLKEGFRRALRSFLLTLLLCSALVAFWLNVQNHLIAWQTSVAAGFYYGIPMGILAWIVIRVFRFAFF